MGVWYIIVHGDDHFGDRFLALNGLRPHQKGAALQRILHRNLDYGLKRRFLSLYRPISQLLENMKLAFALKEQYLNNYKRYHHDRHTVGKVFSLRIR